MNKSTFKFTVRDITEIAIFTALAIIFDRFVKIEIGATGGSLNISLVPIFIICLRHGWFKGFVAGGLVYAIICCLLDMYGIQTFPLEYFIAYGSTCLLGLFANYINKNYGKSVAKTIICYVIVAAVIMVWGVIRFFAASIDSVIFYALTFKEAFAYNAGYVFSSAAADAVIMCLLLHFIINLNKIYVTSYLNGTNK